MPQLSLSDVLAMTPEQCAEYVAKRHIVDPYADDQILGDLADPDYRAWIRALRAR